MSEWRLVESLKVLRDEIDDIAPDRSKASDGTFGDEHHDATSDHTPHVFVPLGSIPVVCALDITHDPGEGADTVAFAEAIRVSRDPRVAYVIAHRLIFSNHQVGSTPAWAWRTYTGSDDPHINHMHVSVVHDGRADNRSPWAVEGLLQQAGSGTVTTMYQIKAGGDFTGAIGDKDAVYMPTENGPVWVGNAEFHSMRYTNIMYVDSWARVLEYCPVRPVFDIEDSASLDVFFDRVADRIIAGLGMPNTREERVQEAFEGAQRAETQ